MSDEAWMDIKLGDISIKGDWAAHLTSVTLTDAVAADGTKSSLKVEFTLPSGSGDKLLPKLDIYGKEWSVKLMDGATPVRTYGGDILEIAWARTGASPRTVTVTGVDPIHRIARGRLSSQPYDRLFRGEKASKIVETIAKEWKFGTSQIESTKHTETFDGSDKNDLQIVKALADENDYILGVAMSKSGDPDLVFARREEFSGDPVKLEFGVDIIDINANHTIAKAVTEVNAYSYCSTRQKKVEAKAASGDIGADNDSGHTAPALLGNIQKFPETLRMEPGKHVDPEAVKKRAVSLLKKKAADFVSGTAKCSFRPDVACGMKFEVEGAGWPFDGKFDITQVTHTLNSSGYTTTVTFKGTSIKAP